MMLHTFAEPSRRLLVCLCGVFCLSRNLADAGAVISDRIVRKHGSTLDSWTIDVTGQVDTAYSSVNKAIASGLDVFVSGFEERQSESEADLVRRCVPAGMRLARVHTGSASFNMVVLGDDDIVSKTIANTGSWEVSGVQDMAAKAGTTMPDRSLTFLDIGANLGYYSLLFANMKHKVISVEPMTRNRKALQGSLCLNPSFKEFVTVEPTALVGPAEAENTTCIVRSTNAEINIGNGALDCGSSVRPCSQGDANCEQVPVRTLDSFLAERPYLFHSGVDVVKMDVEGFECKVLQGGRALFEKNHPVLLQVETLYFDAASCVRDMAAKYAYNLVSEGANTAMLTATLTVPEGANTAKVPEGGADGGMQISMVQSLIGAIADATVA